MMADNFTIDRVEELNLSQRQDSAIANLVGRIFNADMGGRSFAQNRHHRRYMIWQGNALAAHLAVCFRAIRLGERLVNAVGIAEVVVDQPFRKQGMASALLDAALGDAQHSLADFALLFGVENLYHRAGFRNAGNVLTLTPMIGAETADPVRKSDGSFMVKQLGDLRWEDGVEVDLAGFAF